MNILPIVILVIAVIVIAGAFYFWQKKKIIIVLIRKGCLGRCPVYNLTVQGSGKVIFKGYSFIDKPGIQTKEIGKEKVKELVSEFEKINFFSLEDKYNESDVTDLSGAITFIRLNGKTKTIDHYHGNRNAPKELSALENRIDEIVDTKEWIGGGNGKWVR